MSTVIRPAEGQSLADLARTLLALATSPGQVRLVHVGGRGFRVPDEMADIYLAQRRPVVVEVRTDSDAPLPVVYVGKQGPELVALDTVTPPPIDADDAVTTDAPPDPEPAPKRRPGRPRKAAAPPAEPPTNKDVP
jgi:hypothetical protein